MGSEALQVSSRLSRFAITKDSFRAQCRSRNP